jgi:S-formylglutathione hydrolase FrmB
MKYIRWFSILFILLILGCDLSSRMREELDAIGHIGLEPRPATAVKFYSNSLQRDMVINVMLPRGYDKSNARFPVLYLCHGLTANFHEFEYVGVPEYLNRFDMIVVTVDVGNSWYVNWVESAEGEHNDFADHVTQDVIGYVDSHYRTIADRKGRAINGISMGGFGAISLGLSHPELFCSIASHSGALSYPARIRENFEKGKAAWVIRPRVLEDTVTRYRGIDLEGYSTFRERTPKGKPFLTVEDVDAVDPFKLVLQIPKEQLPHIYLDCGLEDGFINSAKEFMQLLLDNDIAFQYGQSAGTHEEDYWGRETSVSMAVQYAIMLRNIWGRDFEIYDAREDRN